MVISPGVSSSKAAKNSMAFSKFCEHLGAPLNNVAWSWCGYSPGRRRAVFTVWADNLVDGRYLFWAAAGAPHHRKHGAKEMRRVIDTVMQTGDEIIGVLCYAKDPKANPRSRARFLEDAVLLLRFVEEPEGTVGYVIGEVATSEALKGPIVAVSPVQDAIDDLGAPPPGMLNPLRIAGTSLGFRRDDAVRRFVIARAKGHCEFCGKQDFLNADGVPYLEAHHIVRLASQGPDTIDNVIALCSSHHREAHYGQRAEELERELLLKLVDQGSMNQTRKRSISRLWPSWLNFTVTLINTEFIFHSRFVSRLKLLFRTSGHKSSSLEFGLASRITN